MPNQKTLAITTSHVRRELLDWTPTGLTLVEDLATGAYG